jgi:ADP-heptose:LPS heptosyltransferase
VLERETAGLADSEWLVVDPDSRVTQLGMLPVARPTVPYVFFESRSYRVAGLETLGELATHWLRKALGWVDDEIVRPRVALSPLDVSHARSGVQALKRRGAPFVVAVNLGVGGNARKRIPGEFELNLIRVLLREGSVVILDHGAGEDEVRVQAIVAALQGEGRRIADVAGSDFSATPLPIECDVVAYRGPVGPFAALIGASDLYVGYDSAFQHIAAALGIPVVDIFVNPPNVVFPRRWRPHSSASVTVIETTSDDTHDSSLTRIVDAHRRLRQAAVVP